MKYAKGQKIKRVITSKYDGTSKIKISSKNYRLFSKTNVF